MLTTSRGVSLISAFAIFVLVAGFLSLMPDSTTTGLLVAVALSFSASYLLISITRELLASGEIGNTYALLQNIQTKELTVIEEKSLRSSPAPLRKINSVVNTYALARQKEIDTLQKNAEFRRELIADISHELKTPIFATQGYIHTLLDGAIEDKQVRMKFLKRAAKSLDSLDVLVQDLLTLNQMESGVIKFTFASFDMKELLQEVVDQIEHKAAKREVTIKLDIAPEKNYVTRADRPKIFRVCQNLIINAVNYNHQGGEVKVSLKTHKNTI